MNSATNWTSVLRRLRSLSTGTPTDNELLAHYTGRQDQLAFATLVQRYGGLVLGVARRQLVDHQQAEDVFQATFLALARSAHKLTARQRLANWLYTVAWRQARKLRARTHRQEELERSAKSVRANETETDPLAAISGRELVQVIDEELARLPDNYRLPVLLCCVRGLSREQVAEQLGWSAGMVKGRLERGRRQLAERLAARGLAPSLVILAPLAAVAVPADLLARTSAQASAPWSSALSPRIAALAASAAPHRLLPLALLGCTLLLAGLVGWAIASVNRSPDDPVRPRPAAVEPVADRSDPLPEGATLRFGTSRYRQGTAIDRMAVSPDGKLAAVTTSSDLLGVERVFDLSDGRVLYTLGERRYSHALAFSPDGKTILTKATYHLAATKITIELFEAATGKQLRKVELPETEKGRMSQWVTFTPDGKLIAMTRGDGHSVVLVDLERGTVVRTFPHEGVVLAAAFSPNGKRLAAGGQEGEKGKHFSRLWDVASGKELHRLEHDEGSLRTIAFSPDGKTVAGGGTLGWVRIWDAQTGKELRKFPKAGSYVQSVAFAPDGRTLAAASGWTSGGDAIRLYEVTIGNERLRINRQASCLQFSPDGKVLTGAVSGAIYRWDTTTGKQLTPQGGDSAIRQVLVTRDARRLITRQLEEDAQLWDATTGQHLRGLEGTAQSPIALGPDSRYLVWHVWDEKIRYTIPAYPKATFIGSRLRLYDMTTNRFVERFPGMKDDPHNLFSDLFFTPDGRTLLTISNRSGTEGTVRVWDFATGKEQRTFRIGCKDAAGIEYYVRKAVLAPDGKLLAVWYEQAHGLIMPHVVRLWDVATGAMKGALPGQYGSIEVAFSPDGRFAVAAGSPVFDRDEQARYQLYLWNLATGRRTAPLPDGLPAEVVALALADDGRLLATATSAGLIQVWEVATWTVRAEYRGHRGRVTSLAFASDGRLLSGGLDTTVLAWDLRPPKVAGALDAAWQALAKRSSAEAFQAQGRLLAAPTEAVKYLAGKLKPAASLDPKRLAALLADLDSPTFATREGASKELAKMDRPALKALRGLAETTRSLEVRKRARDLIAQIEPEWPTLSARELREVRAVEVLGWIATGEAKALLAILAKEEPSAPVTSAAENALKRLKARALER
jgi:RNA polymerase sigma factor (sigma-70 family)